MLQCFSKSASYIFQPLFWSCLLLLAYPRMTSAAEPTREQPTREQIEFFEKKIRPVLVTHCYECHSAQVKPPKGGLLVDSRDGLLRGGDSGPSVVPHKADESVLLDALRYDGLEMPPKAKLPAKVVADFEKWVRMGMPDPRAASAPVETNQIDYESGLKFWAFQKPVKPKAPEVHDVAWAKSEIDRFVLARLEKESINPAPTTDRRTLIRRAYFDLIGLPPEPAAVETFVNDPSPNAFGKVVDELLASEHYGERWGRRWLDVARYGEDQAHTFKARRYPRGYLYRDWVVQAFNADMPYDRFLRHQIAGDLLDQPDRHERLAALGMFALGPVYYQDNGEKAKALADEWDDRVDTLIRGTQGLTISCARCHDHKYDPISMADYYGLLGIFASTKYQERPVVPDEVVQAKRRADADVKDQQLVIDRFLAGESKTVRPQLVGEVAEYIVSAWKVINLQKKNAKDKKVFERTAREDKLNQELLKRWVAYLQEKPASGAVKSERPYLDAWRTLVKQQDPKQDLSKDQDAVADVHAVAEQFEKQAQAVLPQREALQKRFGENVAFVDQADRARVVPGVIPLGNLFDDTSTTTLDAAIGSDKFKADASPDNLGIDRIVQGWGTVTSIAEGIRFIFQSLGSDQSKYGTIVNDGWSNSGGIRTEGKKAVGNLPRTEQGIGMHANALITFDLKELRHAGLIPADQRLVFKVDRAGLNDDVIGSGAGVHLAVIVSRKHSKENVYDAILAGYVNGQPATVEENDMQYFFAGNLPEPIKADGTFVSFDVPIPPEADYLTLIAAGAGKPDEENTISSDHAVFSGARLEFNPLPENKPAVAEAADSEKSSEASRQEQIDAVLVSELLYDKGLLAIPPKDLEKYLAKQPAADLTALKETFAEKQKITDSITVVMAHSLTEGTGKDMQIYRAGDPTKLGDVAPRSFPAIYTGGKRQPFDSAGSGRLKLAQAITSADNPLTARVIANRVWAGHFGQGLVRTPSNFGELGERPTHPELLDYLAVSLMENGWSLKSLHRQIMLSTTYQLSSRFDERNFERDPENKLIWRMNRRRLEVEPWRDAMLAVSGNLNKSAGGPSIDLAKADNNRRTLYGFISRHKLNDLLRLFDFPDPNITSGKRSVTTVPLQQLFVLNSDFMVNQAKALSARLEKQSSSNKDRIETAYQLLFSRPVSAEELEMGLEFLKSVNEEKTPSLTPWEQFSLALLGSSEFTFVD